VRLLVTGGLGFIGSNFIRFMLEKCNNIGIINVDKCSYGSNINNLQEYESDSRYRLIKGDINDAALLRELINGVDVVVNFASETHVDRSIANPWPFIESNVSGVITILETSRKYKPETRVVQISSDEAYGDATTGAFSENDRLTPSSPYAASKAAADLFVLAYHRTYKLDVLVLRSTNNFGPYQFPEKFMPKTIIRALKGLPIPIYGKGTNVRDWIYVKDFCEAIDLTLHKGKSGEIYNVSAHNSYRNIDVAKKILELLSLDHSLIQFVEDRPGHDKKYSIDATKISSELGWKPRYQFDAALKRTVEWYVNNRKWWELIIDENVLHSTPWKLKW